MTTYSRAKTILRQMAQRASDAEEQLQAARNRVARVRADLQEDLQQHAELLAAIDEQAAKEDPLWQALQREKTAIVTECEAARQKAADVRDAIDSARSAEEAR